MYLKGFHSPKFHQILISFDFFLGHLSMACSKCVVCGFAVFIVFLKFLWSFSNSIPQHWIKWRWKEFIRQSFIKFWLFLRLLWAMKVWHARNVQCVVSLFLLFFSGFMKFLQFNTVTLDRRMSKGFHLTEFHQILIIFEICAGNVSVSRVRNV